MAIKGSKPSIFWLHSHFLYWMGGTKYIYEVIKRVKTRFNITVIVEDATPLAFDNYKKIGVKLISLRKTTSTSPLYWLFLPLHILQLRKYVLQMVSKEDNEKTAIITSMFPTNVVAALLPTKRLQYCFEPFAFFHDPEFIKNFPATKKLLIGVAKTLWSGLDIWATKKANKIITLNNTTARYIKEVYKVSSSCSFTGIDSKHFTPFVNKNIESKYIGRQIIVHSTDYTPVKGTDRMITIFSEVKRLIKNSHLVITSTIDNPTEKRRLQRLAESLGISESVEFLGFVDYDILPQIYSLAKVLVQCSYSDRSGTTSMALPVKEAMACGTLAIRFPVKGEDVVDGRTGYLVDPRDTKTMVQKVVTILKMDKKSYNNASRQARKDIVNRYTWEKTAESIAREIILLF